MFVPGQNQLLANLSLLLFLRIFRSFVFMILKRTFEECVSLFSYQRSFFRIAVCFKQLCYYIMLFSACQEVFSTFLKLFLFLSCSNSDILSHPTGCCQELFFATFRLSPNGEGGIWTLARRKPSIPLAGAPLQPLEYFCTSPITRWAK